MPLRFASTSPGFHPVQVQWCTNHQSQTLRTPLLHCSFVTLSDRPASESSVAARAFWNRPERTTRDNPTSPQPESLPLWDQLREAFGDTGDDPGHWNYSPEWYGTQGGGWGRDPGNVIFSRPSEHNGTVQVTAHPATATNSSDTVSHQTTVCEGYTAIQHREYQQQQEWRVLRFNGATRESVARVAISSSTGALLYACPETLAQEYLKTMASLFAAIVGIVGSESKSKPEPIHADAAEEESVDDRLHGCDHAGVARVLCIGLGGGSLPLFLAHHYPEIQFDAVEIDPVVVAAAQQAMGLGGQGLPSNVRIITSDAFPYLASFIEDTSAVHAKETADSRNPAVSTPLSNHFYDVICMDAFNGSNTVPKALRGSEFANLVGSALHPVHGTLVANLHDVPVHAVAHIFHAGISGVTNARCLTVLLDVARQQNTVLCCSRSLVDDRDKGEHDHVEVRLKGAAALVAGVRGYKFLAATRVLGCRALL